jgi:hypothetical protein
MKYLYQADNNLQYIYYITPKCGSRTFFNLFNYDPVEFRETASKYNDYFSWSFVRNPWDRLVSTYTNKIINKHHGGIGNDWSKLTSFKDFILKIEKSDITNVDRHIRSLHTFFPEDIDFIGKLENFQQDFDIICDKIGIPKQKLPHNNKTKHKHYTEYYNDETRQIVAEKYAKDIEYFGYKFGE